MKHNKHELVRLRHLVEDELGLKFRFDPMINPCLNGSLAPLDLRLSPEEIVELDLSDGEREKEWRELASKYWGPPGHALLYTCAGGVSSFHIDATGKLSLCLLSRQETYDLRKGSFRQGWREFIPRVRSRRVTRQTKCRTCELISLCGQCPGWAYLEKGDPEAPVEFLCRVAHQRARRLGLCGSRS